MVSGLIDQAAQTPGRCGGKRLPHRTSGCVGDR
jgi:hypothetical protein